MSYKVEDVRAAAQGNWLPILSQLAPLLDGALKKAGRHVPCPVHGGKDGFRLFKDADETGGGVCNTCGPVNDGFNLLMWVNDWDFLTALNAVGELLRVPEIGKKSSKSLPAKQRLKDAAWLAQAKTKLEQQRKQEAEYSERVKQRITELWSEATPFHECKAYPIQKYLRNRSLFLRGDVSLENLRYHSALRYFDSDGNHVGEYPAILSAIRSSQGDLITLHRTYLTQGGFKYQGPGSARKMMPVPADKDIAGAAIQLGSSIAGAIGIAEGLETALSVYRATGLPTWSCVNTALLETFQPPEGISKVLVWADKDRSGAGQASAAALSERLWEQGIETVTLIPSMPIPACSKGIDWNDVLMTQGVLGFPTSITTHLVRGVA